MAGWQSRAKISHIPKRAMGAGNDLGNQAESGLNVSHCFSTVLPGLLKPACLLVNQPL